MKCLMLHRRSKYLNIRVDVRSLGVWGQVKLGAKAASKILIMILEQKSDV
jgi:hypothetical protein